MAKKTPTIEVHQPALPLNTGPDREGLELHWYWRLRARNGEIVADGAEGYTRRGDARRAAIRAQKIMAEAVILPAKIIV